MKKTVLTVQVSSRGDSPHSERDSSHWHCRYLLRYAEERYCRDSSVRKSALIITTTTTICRTLLPTIDHHHCSSSSKAANLLAKTAASRLIIFHPAIHPKRRRWWWWWKNTMRSLQVVMMMVVLCCGSVGQGGKHYYYQHQAGSASEVPSGYSSVFFASRLVSYPSPVEYSLSSSPVLVLTQSISSAGGGCEIAPSH